MILLSVDPATLKLSKRLSYVLRHDPGSIGARLTADGWAEVDVVLRGLGRGGRPMPRALLAEIVADDPKGRYEFDADGARIRARQGHSIPIDLGLTPVPPPAVLFHGTPTRFLDRIWVEGLRPMNRHHVHLSPDLATAVKVGSRRGQAVVLAVDAAAMSSLGHEFFKTDNDVWLVDEVPARFLSRAAGQRAGQPRR